MHRRFILERHHDVSGVSGTGTIAEGISFSNGRISLQWLVEPCSLTIFNSVNELLEVHGHNGSTRIIWLDEALCASCNFTKLGGPSYATISDMESENTRKAGD